MYQNEWTETMESHRNLLTPTGVAGGLDVVPQVRTVTYTASCCSYGTSDENL